MRLSIPYSAGMQMVETFGMTGAKDLKEALAMADALTLPRCRARFCS
jgi:hypothetical protein